MKSTHSGTQRTAQQQTDKGNIGSDIPKRGQHAYWSERSLATWERFDFQQKSDMVWLRRSQVIPDCFHHTSNPCILDFMDVVLLVREVVAIIIVVSASYHDPEELHSSLYLFSFSAGSRIISEEIIRNLQALKGRYGGRRQNGKSTVSNSEAVTSSQDTCLRMNP